MASIAIRAIQDRNRSYLVAGLLLLVVLATAFGIRASSLSFYSVLSNSMAPTLRAGDLILAKPFEKVVDVGDIVVFRSGRMLVTHRVTSVEPGGLRTKGDANEAEDPAMVPIFSVVGVYQARIPAAGNFLNFVRTPVGWLLVVILPVLWFAVAEIRRAYRLYLERRPSS